MNRGVLRFATAGNVDDGKSTLIGRLLVDTRGAFEDQIDSAQRENERRGGKGIDFALLTDGLKAEREQGITIDVAYRYFATPRRKFIIADAPGHEQYTRNMITAASSADAMLFLLDVLNGLSTQLRRHAYIGRMLGIRHFVLAVNKMDLVHHNEGPYRKVLADFFHFLHTIEAKPEVHCIPISALEGDMVVTRKDRMPWYRGGTVLETLENIDAGTDAEADQKAFRFPVQMVSRPASSAIPDFRGYMGRIASGSIHTGDPVMILPSRHVTSIRSIVTSGGNIESATAGRSVTLTLGHDIDIGRGDLLVEPERAPEVTTEFTATICWLNSTPMRIGEKYRLQQTTRLVKCMVTRVDYLLNMQTMDRQVNVGEVTMNDIGLVHVKTLSPIAVDDYETNRETGAFILIDADNNTVAAGMVRHPNN